MDLNENEDGQTPLNPDEIGGLIPQHLQTRDQLNEWEHMNISKAYQWALAGNKKKKILDLNTLLLLHKKMFAETWTWAGEMRCSMKTIGVPPNQIMNKLIYLIADARGWIAHQSFEIDEIALRFHHKLVEIHVFPNGNGRHARLATEMLLKENNAELFSWGFYSKSSPHTVRQNYLTALRNADRGDYTALKAFVRS